MKIDNNLSFDELLELDTAKENVPKPRCIVRLTTSAWHDKGGVYLKQSLQYLRRKCIGYNILEEDCNNIGAIDVVKQITNIGECKDGVYEVVTCNERSCWGTPHILDDYDYKLIPYEEPIK